MLRKVLSPDEQAWNEFRAAYSAADTTSVFWCPTIDNPVFALVGYFHGRERPDWGFIRSRRHAESVLASYFEPFGNLRAQATRYRELLTPIARAVAESFLPTEDKRGQRVRFADLAKPEVYAHLVSSIGMPVEASPSFGFWFDLADPSGFESRHLSLNFQVEATYATRSVEYDRFAEICSRFVVECGQNALRLLLDGAIWEVIQIEDRVFPKRLTNGETTWLLDVRPVAELIPRLAHDRLRLELTSRTSVIDPPARRWPRQADMRGYSEIGATLVLPPDSETVQVRVSGYSQWLFEALFPTTVSRPYLSGQKWEWHEAPDPILMSADRPDTGDGARVVRAAMYQADPESDHCLCGSDYPSHPGTPSVVALREKAREWIVRAYENSHRLPKSVEWNVLSSPQTYFDLNPPETTRSAESDSRREDVRAGADMAWRNLMNTVFEATPPEVVFPRERMSLSMTSTCAACKDACCDSGSPLVSPLERMRIVEDAGFEDFFVPVGDTEAYWIGKRRDGDARRRDSEGRFTDPCPYFEIEKGCLIHDWKPLDCVLYPYRAAGDGVNLAIQCPSRALPTVEHKSIATSLAAYRADQIGETAVQAGEQYVGSWRETSSAKE